MTREEAAKEMERCKIDIEYMLRTYAKVMDGDCLRCLTNEEVAAAMARSKHPRSHTWPRVVYGKPRQLGGERLMLHIKQKRMWEVMFPGTPYPFEYGGVMSEDGLMTFGVYEKQRNLPVPIKHYAP
jgi:hypothetical protein